MIQLSVVIPLFNEVESLPELTSWIDRVVRDNGWTYEMLLVDDGSKDGSWQVISQLAKSNPSIRGIRFRRNYGKSAALFCGFRAAKGEVVITMDADLQDSPDEIPNLYRMVAEEQYDLVSGWKRKRYDPLSKTLPSKLFNATARLFTGIHLHDFNCGLKAYKRDVVKSIEVFGEMHRYIPVLAHRAGFRRIGEAEVQHRSRKFGVTKYGLERFMNGYLDLLTILFISRFGKSPMHFFGLLGTLVFLAGLLAAGYLGIQKMQMLSQGIPTRLVTESPYFYLALTAMIIGSQLFLTGFIAELVSRNGADRNAYLVEEEI